MARETSNNSGTIFYAKAKNIKPGIDDYPVFELQQKKDGNYVVVDNSTALSGYITHIEKVDKQVDMGNKKKRIRGVKFTIKDPEANESYLVDLTYSNPVRELLNRMASLDSFQDKIKITLYRNNETKFAGMSLKKVTIAGEEKVEQKYPYKEYIKPRITEVTLNGETQRDYSKVDEFFDAMITTVLAKLASPTFDTNYTAPSVTQEEAKVVDQLKNMANTETPHTDINSDLPF